MKNFFTLLALATSFLAASPALESPRFAAADPARSTLRRAAPASKQTPGDDGMRTACREILVDVDEGYGVTNRESRYVCDDPR